MKLLVTFAVHAEFAPWLRRRNFLRQPGDWPVYEANFGAARVRAVLTGMGQEHALVAAKRFLAEKPDICISTGMAGALRGDYRPGDILAARLVGEVGEPLAVASHRELLSTAVDCGARQIERLATSKTVIARAELKQKLSNEADAVEMESYVILAEAARHGVPAVAIRAVSDTVSFDIPYNFDQALDKRGQIKLLRIFPQILRRPGGLPALLRLGRNSRLAARRLADFLDAFAGTMADRLIPIETIGTVAAT